MMAIYPLTASQIEAQKKAAEQAAKAAAFFAALVVTKTKSEERKTG